MWAGNPFAQSNAVENFILGLVDNGMNDRNQPRFVIPSRVTKVSHTVMLLSGPSEKAQIKIGRR